MMTPRLLMCPPEHFTVKYRINPWMRGQRGKVNVRSARKQWNDFYRNLRRVARVDLMEPHAEMPDLVFTANAGFLHGGIFIPSRFRYRERQPEETRFKTWFRSRGYTQVDLPPGPRFEGAGDALLQPGTNRLWTGHGFRSDPRAHNFLARVHGFKIVSLRLVNPEFYHLDTCFCPLARGQVMYYPPAFDAPSVTRIEQNVLPGDRIILSREDARSFACNAVLVDPYLFVHSAGRALRSRLKQAGYTVVLQPVSEFLKAGGATKCLTLALSGGVSRRDTAGH